jgi:hypothetical protein
VSFPAEPGMTGEDVKFTQAYRAQQDLFKLKHELDTIFAGFNPGIEEVEV